LEADDKILVERCKEGDKAAFRQLVLKYQRKVYMQIYSMISNHQDAMELSQEVFLRVHRHLPSFEGTSSFYTWLYRITRNICIDYYRKRKVKKYEYDDKFDHSGAVEEEVFPVVSSASRETPTGRLLREELARKIEEAMKRLSDDHRETLFLREVEGKSYEEIAADTGVPIGTVMSRLFHARKKMQKMLSRYLH